MTAEGAGGGVTGSVSRGRAPLMGRQRCCRGGPWGVGLAAGGGLNSGRRVEPLRRLRKRHPQQTTARPLLATRGSAGSCDEEEQQQGGDDGEGEGEGLLLFGGLDDYEEVHEDDEDEAVIEVDEEELKEEWIARGLNPEAFDPFVLLQMWEEEDEQVDADVCDVCVYVCVCACVSVCMCAVYASR